MASSETVILNELPNLNIQTFKKQLCLILLEYIIYMIIWKSSEGSLPSTLTQVSWESASYGILNNQIKLVR